jgi:translation initiation factor IF-1
MEDIIEIDGVVIQTLPGAKFNVELENGHRITAVLNGKLRTNKINIITGDRIKCELSPYDITKGRICWRYLPPKTAASATASEKQEKQ